MLKVEDKILTTGSEKHWKSKSESCGKKLQSFWTCRNSFIHSYFIFSRLKNSLIPRNQDRGHIGDNELLETNAFLPSEEVFAVTL